MSLNDVFVVNAVAAAADNDDDDDDDVCSNRLLLGRCGGNERMKSIIWCFSYPYFIFFLLQLWYIAILLNLS